jgi:hypothetical protein
MPNDLNIQNISNSDPIIITLKSINKNETLLDTKECPPNQSINSTVKGGVKMLSISDNNGLWWEGYVPSFISQPIKVNYDNKEVTYDSHPLVNILKNSVIDNSMYIYVGIFILFVILVVWWLYYKKRK